jgi:hypothetical protein
MPVSAEGAYIRMLLYGDPGVGKSVLAGRSPRALMLVNDPDETSSMFLHGSTADRWHIRDYGDLTDAHDYLLHGGTKEYDWVWLDNGTLIQEQGMDQIMMDLVAEKPHRNQFIPDKPEYLENQNRFGTLVRNFKSLDINLGITAHSERFEDDDGKVVYKPMFQGGQGKFSDKICGYMGCVFYMSAIIKDGEKQRVLITDKRGKYMAKDRYSTYQSGRLINPDMPVMLDQIAKARAKQQAAEKAASTTKSVAKRTVTKRSA